MQQLVECIRCALLSLVFSVAKRQTYWDSKDIGFVVENGDMSLNCDDYKMFYEHAYNNKIMSAFSVESLAGSESKLLNYESVPGTIIDKSVNPQQQDSN